MISLSGETRCEAETVMRNLAIARGGDPHQIGEV